MPKSEEKCVALLSTTAVDLNAVAATVLYTVPPDKTAIMAFAWVRTSYTGSHAALAFTVGLSTALTDWITLCNGDNLAAAGDVIIVSPVPSATPALLQEYTAGEIVSIDVTVAVGAATTGTLYLFDFEDDA